MKLGSVIGNLNATNLAQPAAPAVKTAGDASPGNDPVERASIAALNALRPGGEKTASAQGAAPANPVDALRAQAEKLASIDKVAEVAFSRQLGAEFGDAFLQRIAQSEMASSSLLGLDKTASNISPDELALVKMARENPGQFLAEVERGYRDGIERQKTASYDEDFLKATRGIHHVASNHYVHGYQKTAALIEQSNAGG